METFFRFKPPVQQGQPLADKIVVVLFLAAFVRVIVFIPLDVFRFHLMANPGTLASSFGLVLFAAGRLLVELMYPGQGALNAPPA